MSPLSFIELFEDVYAQFVHDQLFFAPFLLLAIEEIGIPLPVPGDFVLFYLGFQISQHGLNLFIFYTAIVVSVLIGSTIMFFLSAKYGNGIIALFGKYMGLNTNRIRTIEQKFRKYGPWVIIFGRFVPGFKIPITIFAATSGMKYIKFISYTGISVILWVGLGMYIGTKIGTNAQHLLHSHQKFYFIGFIPIVLTLLFFFLRYMQKKKHAKNDELA